jgi:hypothetical protein
MSPHVVYLIREDIAITFNRKYPSPASITDVPVISKRGFPQFVDSVKSE